MTTGESLKPQHGSYIHNIPGPIPYFCNDPRALSTGLWAHLNSHLQLKRRKLTSNPYLVDPGAGFHTTFYEVREKQHLQQKELWKHGPLYDHPLGSFFRKSAYTVSAEVIGSIHKGLSTTDFCFFGL